MATFFGDVNAITSGSVISEAAVFEFLFGFLRKPSRALTS
jgi:hypothetical protein